MGDFNHGHIQWTYLRSTGREDQEFKKLVQHSLFSKHNYYVRTNLGQERVGHSF